MHHPSRLIAKDERAEPSKSLGKRASEPRPEEFELLVESVQDYAIFMLDPEGMIRSWNSGGVRITGYHESEAVGLHVSVFFGPDEQALGKPRIDLEIAEREGRVEEEGWRIRKDGSRFWSNDIITLLRDREGGIRGFVNVMRDMTDRRAAVETLRQSAEIFQLLVSAVREYAIFMLDPEGNIATWNLGAQRIKGYAPKEIIGRHFSTFYSEEDIQNGKPARELAIARELGSVEDEGWRVRKDGTRFWANVVITAVYDAQGALRGFAKVTRDITDRKKAEETQRALLEQREARVRAEEERRHVEDSYRVAQEANRAKDEFLMTLSHELRTPMTAILGWARMLPMMRPDDPAFREAVASIASGAQLQARLIDDILDVSRIVSGKLRLAPETVDVARVVKNSVDAVSPTAAAKQITLTTSLAPDLGVLLADATRLQQVIWNLLTNAVKFTPRLGVVTVTAQRTASHVEIAVSDTGEGIDQQFLPHIFEPFRQAESPQTRVHGGLGLGLSIVRYIAEAHGGTVFAESQGRGHGATFTVMLPVNVMSGNKDAVTNPFGDTFLHRDRLRGIEIVLVDDEVESRRLLNAVLRAAGANVQPFDSANAALLAIDERRPDVVVTDIAMPVIDGYALTRALRERDYGEKLKIVALSAFTPDAQDQHIFAAYLSKPIDPFRLVEEIAKVVGPKG
jgi:PAS domain S-box-containing protein